MAESFGDGIGMMTLMIIPRYLGKFLASGYDQLTKGKPWKKITMLLRLFLER